MKLKYMMRVRILLLLLFVGVNIQTYSQHNLYGLWAKRTAFGSTGSATTLASVVDESGNVYVAGIFNGKLNFQDDVCSPTYYTANGNKGAFLIKYNADGEYQWSLQFDAPQNTGASVFNMDYKNGKLLIVGSFAYSSGVSLPIVSTITGPVNSATMSITTINGTGNAGSVIVRPYALIVNTSDGELGTLIAGDDLQTGTHAMYGAIEGSEIVILRWWPVRNGGIGNMLSIAGRYNLTTGTLINEINYPGQPIQADGSRLMSFTTLDNGKRAVLHRAFWGSMNNYDTWIMIYNHDFSSQEKILKLATHPYSANDGRANSAFVSTDGTDIYLLRNDIKGLYKFDTNLNVLWSVALHADYMGTDVKTVGNYTHIVGRFKGNNIEFNPLGTSIKLSSTVSTQYDGFYAVYNNANGKCVYAVNMGGTKNDKNTTLSLSNTASKVLIGGSYVSPIFEIDPADRLYALTGNGTNEQGFVALYSTSAFSSYQASSFGDAPASYGTAVHHAYTCLRLGGIDLSKVQYTPEFSVGANTAQNDDGINIPYNGGYVDLTSSNFKLNTSGALTATVKVYNASDEAAKVFGWIDFNQNGEFDGASEASLVATVAANTTASNATVTLTWAGANTKLINGKTYMRLRITSDNIDNTQPFGLFFNGEVEDYSLDIKLLELSKTAESNNALPHTANIGDTITYKINLQNTSPVTINGIGLFDPIPQYTTYVPNSAKIGSTLVTTTQPQIVTVNGQNVQAVVWPNFNLASGALSSEYSFKVVVTDRPQNADSIFNIAYAVMNSDTIASVGASCNMAEIAVNALSANKDYYAVFKNDSIMSAFIGANDTDPNRVFVRDTILNVEKGAAVLNEPRDGTLKYNTASNYLGLDSIDYRIKTANDSVDSRAYVAVITTESQKYVACPGAEINIKLLPDNNSRITYEWYKNATGGSAFATGTSINVTMGNNDTVFYVQVIIDGNNASPRLPVDVWKSDNCGTTTPTGCAVDGTLLFREDFGGNNLSDPEIGSPLPSSIISYTYNPANMNLSGVYSIIKKTKPHPSGGNWYITGDHTSLTDDERGYLLQINAGAEKGKFYEYQIDNLCEGTKLYFSGWIFNVQEIPVTDKTNMIFVLEDPVTGNIIAQYYTGDLPDADPRWKYYGFEFQMPANQSSLKLKIINNGTGTQGNDFALDDIEIRLCVPKANATVNAKLTDTICSGDVTLVSSYTDNGIFTGGGETLKGYWLESLTGDINEPSDWTKITGSDVSGATTVTSNLSVTPAENTTTYYRFIVSNQSNINNVNCRAASDVIWVTDENCLTAVRDTATAETGSSTIIDVLANDSIRPCDRGTLTVFDTIPNSGLHYGTLVINPDSTFTYISVNAGVDSVDYFIKCGADSSAARVYVVSLKPLSKQYIACPDARVTMGFTAITGVQYNWYNAASGGSIVTGGSNTATLAVVKDNSAVQSWWVEPLWNGIKFPRFQVDLLLSANCGITNPTGCPIDGTLIWKEDFDRYDDGLDLYSPAYSQEELPAGMTTYAFSNKPGVLSPVSGRDGIYRDASYAIVKDAYDPAHPSTFLRAFRDDHTFPNDNKKGRFLLTNGRTAADRVYVQEVDNLCSGMELHFSFWMGGYDGEVEWTIYAEPSNEVLVKYKLPKLPSSSLSLSEWKFYGFPFEVPDGVSSIRFEIYNNATEASGNDVAYDDIAIYLCTPPVNIINPSKTDTVVCPNSNFVFEGNYTDTDGTFGSDLVYHWEYSETGNVNVATDWSKIAGTDGTSLSGTMSSTYTISNVDFSDEGYYRLVVASPSLITQVNCRAMSKIVHLGVHKSPTDYPDIRIQTCPNIGGINLTSYLNIDTADFKSITWSELSTIMPAISAVGKVNTNDMVASHTYGYEYTLQNSCYSPVGKLYVHTLFDKTLGLPPDTVVVCCEQAKALQLNQIFGLGLDGTWVYSSAVNPDNTLSNYIDVYVAPEIHAGARIFDAYKAWRETSNSYLISGGYNGDMTAKKFKIRYITNSSSCIGATVKDVVIIVTKNLQ